MTRNAGENGVVRCVGVAIGATRPAPSVAPRIDREPRVIEYCSQPRGGVVARVAGGREHCRFVVWTVGAVVFRLMTAVAVLREAAVVAAFVAIVALDLRVSSSQRETRLAVIKARGTPSIR